MKTRAPGQPHGTPRDLSVSALILGVAAMMWFGWGQSQPPAGRPAYTAPWILLVVGVHFLPLGRLFGSVDLLWSGLVLCAVAIAAAVTGAVSAVAPSAVTGGFGGLVLVAAAVASLRRAAARGRFAGAHEG